MNPKIEPRRNHFASWALALVIATLAAAFQLQAADHKDSPDTSDDNLDITDLYVFNHGDSIVFVMNVSPFLTPGTATQNAYFNPNGLYQFKLDKNRDGKEDAVIQVTFSGTGSAQTVTVMGPGVPTTIGSTGNVVLNTTGMTLVTGKFNEAFTGQGVTAFAGPRDDPFFLHLLGDSSLTSVLNGAYSAALKTTVGSASEQTLAFSKTGKDDFAGANVLSIVLQFPKSAISQALGITADGAFSTWATTSKKD